MLKIVNHMLIIHVIYRLIEVESKIKKLFCYMLDILDWFTCTD